MRYLLITETTLSTDLCEDCGSLYSIVIRAYEDQAERNPDGTRSVKETSVRTSCYCVTEHDPFREVQPPMVDMRNPRNYPKAR